MNQLSSKSYMPENKVIDNANLINLIKILFNVILYIK
jgi:hypothetical protein